MIHSEFFNTKRLAGLLMLLSVTVILGAAAFIAWQGKLHGMTAAFRGVSPWNGDISGLQTIARFAIIYSMMQLAAFALLTLLLHEAGDGGLALNLKNKDKWSKSKKETSKL